ncbi:hypothetical protein BDZ94DRAFT_459789 [Collybia nuda]|uniref:Uncharacterized protein n=1 Tax=Collybia nuda TaxID=64659 RepID=A0A9P6CLF0_9AGAR|nr:hypothetical protein BDZ94DRAFT_459789 [Collybia nuda]
MFKASVIKSLATRLPRRGYRYSARTPWRKDTTPGPSVFVEENFAKHTLFVLDVGKRFFKFSIVGLIALGTTAATVYEGLHLYVEHVELAPEQDAEVKRWEWDQDTEKWTGNTTKGGTDAALGFKGRHIVRAAWMAYNWGVGYSTAVIGSDDNRGSGLVGPGGLNIVDARLQRTEDFLNSAISIAEKRVLNNEMDPQTITELVVRRAMILERLGPGYLLDSRDQYARAWVGMSQNGHDAARVAAKLGDISFRLGQADDALTWWSRAIRTIVDEPFETLDSVATKFNSVPSSPSAQRLLSSVFVSLSAFYAKSGQLRHAQSIEEASLNMLRSTSPPESMTSTSPPQALHALYLLQRSALLSIHLAEVLHAQRNPVASSIHWLTSAAQSSERVVHGLSGLFTTGPGGSTNSVPHIGGASLLPAYNSSRSLNKAANGLLRDARRTAAEAWNLMGILNEAQGKDLRTALRCYERAVDWAGTPPGKADIREAAEGTLESDWLVFWGNYTRARLLVEQSQT